MGLLFAFMPVLAHKPGGSEDSGAMIARLLFRQAPSTSRLTIPVVLQAGGNRTALPEFSVLRPRHSAVSPLPGSWLPCMKGKHDTASTEHWKQFQLVGGAQLRCLVATAVATRRQFTHGIGRLTRNGVTAEAADR